MPVLLGHVVISGCADGVVAISNPASGLVVRVISDHQGAPITDLQYSTNPLMVYNYDCVLLINLGVKSRFFSNKIMPLCTHMYVCTFD